MKQSIDLSDRGFMLIFLRAKDQSISNLSIPISAIFFEAVKKRGIYVANVTVVLFQIILLQETEETVIEITSNH